MREEIIFQAKIAQQKELKVILGPQFNMEMSPGGSEALSGEKSNEWGGA